MKSKKQEQYKIILSKITEMTKNYPEYFIIDFELAVYNSIKEIMPNTIINGCNFHFNQLIVRFLNVNNILKYYKTDEHFKKFVKYLLLLAYVPLNMIEYEFEKIKNMKRNIDYYDNFLDYFEKSIINNKMEIKKREFWSVNERIIKNIATTTNSCGAFHRHLNTKIERKNQQLIKIISILKNEERR
ncbi:hypothetical protein DMUE_6219, partial [Dictyocoela muelleri]